MSRSVFSYAGLPAAALALMGLALLRAEPGQAGSSLQSDPLIVGEGKQRFTWSADWMQLPADEALGSTHGRVAVDRSGNVYVLTNTERAVCVFDPEGRFVRSFGAELAGGLHGMALVTEASENTGSPGEPTVEEFLYLTHIVQGRVVKTTLAGDVVWSLGWPEGSGLYERADQYHPTGVAVASNGDVFVADGYGRSWIHHYDREQRYLGSFGGPGRERGKLRNPHDLALLRRGEREVLLVPDRENSRVQIFDLDGRVLGVWSEGLRRPAAIAVRDGVTAVGDIDGGVVLLDAGGRPIAVLGEQPDPALRDRDDLAPSARQAARFVSPHGVAWGTDGSLFVVEWLREGRVTKLERQP